MTNIELLATATLTYAAITGLVAWLICRARPLTQAELRQNAPRKLGEAFYEIESDLTDEEKTEFRKWMMAQTAAPRIREPYARRAAGTAAPSEAPGTGESSPAPVLTPPEALKTALLITGCSDPSMWYANLVGQEVPYLGNWQGEGVYKSREPAGYVNIVKTCDARLIIRRPK